MTWLKRTSLDAERASFSAGDAMLLSGTLISAITRTSQKEAIRSFFPNRRSLGRKLTQLGERMRAAREPISSAAMQRTVPPLRSVVHAAIDAGMSLMTSVSLPVLIS